MNNLEKEMSSLRGERKMNEVALKGYQHSLAEQLNSTMGQDINDVLSGKKKVKLSFWKKIKHKFDSFLWHLTSEQ